LAVVKPDSGVRPYLIGLGGVVLVTLVRLPFEWTLDGRAPYALFYLPLLFLAWRYGVGPTVATACLSMLVAWVVVLPPHFSLVDKPRGAVASAVLFAIVSFAMTLLSRKAGSLREKALRNAEASREAERVAAAQREWFRVTLSSIGDAVIASDAQGRVTFVNPIAEKLTGWTAAEAVGQPLSDVFRLVDELTRQPVDNPADWVLRKGVVGGLAQPALLVAGDGKEIPIADSAAPIHAEDGSIQGVVLVFRDVSERRAADQEKQTAAQQRERMLESERVARSGPTARIASRTSSWPRCPTSCARPSMRSSGGCR
jgi:PAS domain S-box-containing protein